MAPSDPRQTKFVLDESRIPRAWYNIAADLPEPRRRRSLHPGTGQPIGPGRPRAALPDGAHRPAGREHRARDRDPGAGPRRLPAVPSEPALSRPPPRAGARYAGPHLLQVRGRQPVRQPQAEHRAAAGVLQPGRRASSASRPRPAPVSGAARSRSPAPMFGLEVKVYMVRASYDQKPYRRDPDGDVRGRGRGQPEPGHRIRTRRPGRDAGSHRARWAWRSARRSRTRSPTPARSTRSGRCSTSCSSTRRSSARKSIDQMEMAGEEPDVIIGCAGRRLQLRRAGLPVAWPDLPRRSQRTGSSPPSPRPPQPDPRRVRLRLRRHRPR